MDIEELVRRAVGARSDLDPADQRRLLRYLVELGASEEELTAAVDVHNVGGLALELAIRRGSTRPFAEAAEQAGASPAEAARLWRSLGFPDPVRNPTALPEDAVEAVRLLVDGCALLGEEATVALGRVVGTATSRMAQAVLDAFRIQFEAPQLAAGSRYSQVVRDYTDIARDMLPRFVDAVGAILLRHLVAVASSGWFADAEGGVAQQDLAVGFADITGYTALSRSLTPRELSRIIAAFEEAVSEATSQHGGRLVKLVGDGALFSAEDVDRAVRIATAVVDKAGDSQLVHSVRVGVAAGEVVNLGGDVFGPVVNLAARLVAVAPDSSVVVDEAVVARSVLGFSFEPLPPHDLKGIGTPSVAYRVVRPDG